MNFKKKLQNYLKKIYHKHYTMQQLQDYMIFILV